MSTNADEQGTRAADPAHPHGAARYGDSPLAPASPPRRAWQVICRTADKAWSDSIFGKSATAAFWQTLSLPPLLLGLLGSLGYVSGWFGPDTLEIIERKIIAFSRDAFSPTVVDQLIQPTVTDVLERGHSGIVSLGFLLSLWAGSSAISTFVDSIVEAHGQQDARHPVWQRIFALLLYLLFLVAAVFVLPLVALGPVMIGRVLPESWYAVGSQLLDFFYYPGVGLLLILGLTTLYKLALHKSLPWHRLLGGALLAGVFFMVASAVLRRYLSWVATGGVSYGALATPIAFLLFTFFLGFAVILGAEFNATIQEFWPARATRMEQMRDWLASQAADGAPVIAPVTNLTKKLATGPIKVARAVTRGDDEAADTDRNAIADAPTEPMPRAPLRSADGRARMRPNPGQSPPLRRPS